MIQSKTTGGRAGAFGSTAATRCAGFGSGAGDTIFGAEIEPVMSAASRLKRSASASVILTICAYVVSLAASTVVFGVARPFESRAMVCRIALLSSTRATSLCAGGASTPRAATAPTTAPKAAANVPEAASNALRLWPALSLKRGAGDAPSFAGGGNAITVSLAGFGSATGSTTGLVAGVIDGDSTAGNSLSGFDLAAILLCAGSGS